MEMVVVQSLLALGQWRYWMVVVKKLLVLVVVAEGIRRLDWWQQCLCLVVALMCFYLAESLLLSSPWLVYHESFSRLREDIYMPDKQRGYDRSPFFSNQIITRQLLNNVQWLWKRKQALCPWDQSVVKHAVHRKIWLKNKSLVWSISSVNRLQEPFYFWLIS